MGLIGTSNLIFTQEWVDGLSHIPESGMAAEIEIVVPGQDTGWDETTNTPITTPDTVLYTGKARVQPIRSANQKAVPTNSTSVQTVLFSIPVEFQSLALKLFYQVRVLEAPLNPTLTAYKYVLSEVLDSSNPLEKTFYCTVDLEKQV